MWILGFDFWVVLARFLEAPTGPWKPLVAEFAWSLEPPDPGSSGLEASGVEAGAPTALP